MLQPVRFALLSLAFLLAGCPDPQAAPSTNAPPATSTDELVIYCGRSESLVAPVFERFTRESGVKLSVRYGKTPALASQLISEGADSPADVLFAQDSGYLGALSDQGALAALPEALLEAVDPRFRDPRGKWVGTSGRARVLVYGTEALEAGQLPASLEELSDPKWKGKLGWAPGNSSFQAHVSHLRHTWGEAKTKAWLEALKANEPKVYPKNSPQVAAAIAGEIQIGWVNHYYLYRQPEDAPAANYSFRAAKDAGNVLMVAGVGVRAASPKAKPAEQLIAFLLGEAAQTHFAQETFEYPTVPGTPTHERVPPLESLNLGDVNQDHLADIGPTLELLQTLGLQ